MTKKRPAKWHRAAKLATPLTVACGLIAVTYIMYRVTLLTVPVVSFERLVHPGSANAIVCGQEEAGTLLDPSPVLSSSYQKRVASQASSPNLVTNPTMTERDSESGEPIGYSHNIDSGASTFEYLRDRGDRQLFLRVINEQAKNENAPLWQIDPVPLHDGQTYAYGFSYRSSIPVQISIEYTKNGQTSYQDIMIAHASSSWQNVSAHFNNMVGATTFRVLVAGQSKGYVDSRHYEVRRIPDARLDTGIVSVAFDDGWQSVKTKALPLLDTYHIRTTQYVISEISDRNTPEYMNMATLAELKKHGHEIASHSLLHCNQTGLSKDLVEDNALRSKVILEQRGLGPIKSFAYPLGQYNETTQDIFRQHYPLLRTSDFGYNDRYFDETNIHSMGVLDTTSDSEFQQWLDYARSNRMWVVIVYHRVDESGEYSVSSQQLARQLNMIRGSGLKVLPISEAAESIRK